MPEGKIKSVRCVPLFWALLAGAALLYFFLLPLTEVGAANDDALYILGAQSLLHGHYASLQYPRHPALTDPLPGYPLFLAPFVALVQPHWKFLKLTSVALTLLNGFLLWCLLKRGDALLAIAAAAFFWLNPATAASSGRVLSEPCFLFFTLLLFLAFQKRPPPERSPLLPGWILGLLLGWAMLVRPQGAVLWIAWAAALALWRGRSAVGMALISAALFAAVLVRNVALTGRWTGYLTHWMASFSGPAPLTAAERWRSTIQSLFGQTLLGAAHPLPSAALLLAAAAFAALAALGFQYFLEKSFFYEEVLLALGIFCVGCFLLQTLWVAADSRYFLAVLPFMLAFIIGGARRLAGRHRRLRGLCAAAGILLLGFYIRRDAALLREAWTPARAADASLPQATYQWIRTNLPEDAMILNSKPSTLFLYTQRHASFTRPAASRDEFRYGLLRGRISYILFQPAQIASPLYRRLWEQTAEWVASSPEAFPLRFENPSEATRLYQIRPDVSFLRAFERRAPRGTNPNLSSKNPA